MDSITPGEMSSIEDGAEALGISKLLLMENAGASLAREIQHRVPSISEKRIVAVVGTGNNGGDALACARHLSGVAKMMVFLLKSSQSIKTSESSINWKILEKMPKSIDLYQNTSERFVPNLMTAIEGGDVVIDGILGTGVKGQLREPIPSIVKKMNSSEAYKVAVDVPTGLDPATGKVSDVCIKADLTVTFHKAKTGLMGNLTETGEIVVAPIGIPLEATKD